jgi:hypothetical protein
LNVLEKYHEALTYYAADGDLSEAELDECANSLVQNYSWVIPSYEVLEAFKNHYIVEIGAGNGYWASLYSKLAVKVDCYDKYPSQNPYYPVKQGDPSILEDIKNTHWILFICSPQYRSNMVLESLRYFRGHTFYYAGDENFGLELPSIKEELKTNWNLLWSSKLSNWPRSNNKFMVFRRKDV